MFGLQPTLIMTNKIQNRYLKFIQAIIKWLVNRVNIDYKLSLCLKGLVLKIFKIKRSRGTKEAIRYCKERRAFLFRLLSLNSKLDFSSDLQFPKDLKFLKTKGSITVPYIKLLLTVFSISRAFRIKAEPSFQTIKGPSTMKEYPFKKEDFDQFWYTLGYSKKLKPGGKLNFKRFHKTSRSGPNGQALWFCLTDLVSLSPENLQAIFLLGGEKLRSYIEITIKYLNFLSKAFPIKLGISRKLIYFSDREGKTREVAILDYYSQTSLIPLHKYLFKALKRIPQDFTFEQTGYMSSLSNAEVFYSIDLTAFTDRFPIRVNRDLLESRIGPEKADAWFQIMTQKFITQDNEEIRYSVGNPMGAYSSWNSTTLSHHFVVWKACRNKGVNWKTLPYAMLGDDLVIGHKLVALEYCRLIRTLGVHWSKEKTHVSPHFFEFAKRFHWNGNDISPFPIAGLWSERNRLVGQIQVLDNAISKGWFSTSECQESLDELFSHLGFPRRLRTKRIDSMIKSWRVISVLQKKASALELIPFVEKISTVVARKLDEEKTFNVLVSSIMLSFVDSSENLTDKSKHKDGLGQMAEHFTMFLTQLMFEPGFEDTVSLPESIPHTHVWGVISEDYLRSQREAFIIDTIRGGDWDPLLRNLKIPVSDTSIYFGRKMDLLYLHSSKIVEKFEENIRQLAMYPQLI